MDANNSIVKSDTKQHIQLKDFCNEAHIETGTQLLALATMMYSGGFANKTHDSPAKVMAAMMYGRVIGIHPMRAPMVIANINGNMSIWGAEVMAQLLKSGQLEHYEATDIKHEKTGAFLGVRIVLKRKGIGGEFKGEWTLADSETAGTIGNHKKYPRDHCHWKALARAAKHGFGDILAGFEVAEDVGGVQADKRVVDTTATETTSVPDPLADVPDDPHQDDKRTTKPADDAFANEMAAAISK